MELAALDQEDHKVITRRLEAASWLKVVWWSRTGTRVTGTRFELKIVALISGH